MKDMNDTPTDTVAIERAASCGMHWKGRPLYELSRVELIETCVWLQQRIERTQEERTDALQQTLDLVRMSAGA